MIDKWEDRWEWLRLGKCLHAVQFIVRGERVDLGLRCGFASSAGGAPVLAGRRCGRGVAAGTGALPVQQGDGAERGRGGETHQTPRGLREVGRHLGGTLRCAGEADHGERAPRESAVTGLNLSSEKRDVDFVLLVPDGVTGSEKKARGRREEETTAR